MSTATADLAADLYYRDIKRFSLLTDADEIRLATAIRDPDLSEQERLSKRNELIQANLRLVFKYASKYCGRGLEFDDLVAYGTIGLFNAAKKYEPCRLTADGRRVRFSTYATSWIISQLRYAVLAYTRTVYVPPRLLGLASKYLAMLRQELAQQPDFDLCHRRTIKRLNVSPRKEEYLSKVIRFGTFRCTYSLDQDDMKPLASDHPAEPDEPEPSDLLYRVLGSLSERTRDIISMRFGLGGNKPATLKEIGRKYGISRERVRQIQDAGLLTVRDALAGSVYDAGDSVRRP